MKIIIPPTYIKIRQNLQNFTTARTPSLKRIPWRENAEIGGKMRFGNASVLSNSSVVRNEDCKVVVISSVQFYKALSSTHKHQTELKEKLYQNDFRNFLNSIHVTISTRRDHFNSAHVTILTPPT